MEAVTKITAMQHSSHYLDKGNSMARGVNKVILIGNLGRDPEIKYMPNGQAVANFSIATSESWKDQQGQVQERTEWHNIVMYRRLAEIAGEYLQKGSKVYLEGKLQTSKWQDQQTGQDRYKTEVVALEMQMLDSRPQGQQGGYQDPAHQQQHRPAQGQQSTPQYQPAPGAQQQQPRPRGQGYGNQPQQPEAQSQQMARSTPQQNFTPDLDDGWDDDIPFAPIGLQYPALLLCC